MNGNSVKKDISLVFAFIVGFYLTLVGAGWVDGKLGLTQAYTLVDIASLSLKVFTASALVWILKRLAFKNTLGADFGATMNAGWNQMSTIEKTRWVIGVFVALFTAIIIAGSR